MNEDRWFKIIVGWAVIAQLAVYGFLGWAGYKVVTWLVAQ